MEQRNKKEKKLKRKETYKKKGQNIRWWCTMKDRREERQFQEEKNKERKNKQKIK